MRGSPSAARTPRISLENRCNSPVSVKYIIYNSATGKAGITLNLLIIAQNRNMLPRMHSRQLGSTDLNLTTVGLGTWAIGGPWQFGWGPQDDNEAIAAIVAGLDLGINWIDTAPIYGLGHSEELVGKALRQTKHKPYIATKCGLLGNEKREKVPCLERRSIAKECHASLKRLGVEVIDLYQMHWPEPEEDIEQAWEEMAKLAEQGKVRYIGVSNFNIQQIERISKIHAVASLQPPYSMLHREAEDGLLQYCAKNNIGVIAYSPMQRGLLTGRFSRQRLASLAVDDHRRRNPDFQEPQFQRDTGTGREAQENCPA